MHDGLIFKGHIMDWFQKLTGFAETHYDDTRKKLRVEGRQLTSLVNNKSYGIGTLELASLQALRKRVKSGGGLPGRLKVSVVQGDVRRMHQLPENPGALFQVASQFNLLEMTSSDVSPEDGVTRYEHDRTQGPACAIAAGAATIYRNYFAPVRGYEGQTKHRQFDGLASLGDALSASLDRPVGALWTMQNGYALCSDAGLTSIGGLLGGLLSEQLDDLRGKLCIGLHQDVEVTDANGKNRPLVSQAFCSALPVAYTDIPPDQWKPFATLVLEAAYEATMLAAILNAQRGVSNTVLLTLLGGGAFGNKADWIYAAIRRALDLMAGFELDVRIVTFSEPSRAVRELTRHFSVIDRTGHLSWNMEDVEHHNDERKLEGVQHSRPPKTCTCLSPQSQKRKDAVDRDP
jgi:hypothetical protein